MQSLGGCPCLVGYLWLLDIRMGRQPTQEGLHLRESIETPRQVDGGFAQVRSLVALHGRGEECQNEVQNTKTGYCQHYRSRSGAAVMPLRDPAPPSDDAHWCAVNPPSQALSSRLRHHSLAPVLCGYVRERPRPGSSLRYPQVRGR